MSTLLSPSYSRFSVLEAYTLIELVQATRSNQGAQCKNSLTKAIERKQNPFNLYDILGLLLRQAELWNGFRQDQKALAIEISLDELAEVFGELNPEIQSHSLEMLEQNLRFEFDQADLLASIDQPAGSTKAKYFRLLALELASLYDRITTSAKDMLQID